MKRILLITTGGTIACRKGESGLEPVLSADELLAYVPTARELCATECVTLMNKDSTEIVPADWLKMSECVRENYDAYDGFVITHGTDTMAYTSAALSYLIQRSPKPVVLTGSQRPIDADINDARQNLLDALRCASDARSHGVFVVFDGKVIAGARAKKMNTKSYNAFASLNYPLVAEIRDDRMYTYIERECAERAEFFGALCERVALVKLAPGSTVDLLEHALATSDAVVVESFGTGGLPARFYPALERAAREGKHIVATTQVPGEGSDMAVYKVGREIKNRLSLLESFDMTLEATLAKLMWALAVSGERERRRELFNTPIGEDMLAAIGGLQD